MSATPSQELLLAQLSLSPLRLSHSDMVRLGTQLLREALMHPRTTLPHFAQRALVEALPHAQRAVDEVEAAEERRDDVDPNHFGDGQ